MIYKMTLKDSVDTMTFNLLETPIVDKDIEGAVDNVTLDGNQYTDYLYLKKQYIQKWAIMCPDEYDELRGFYTRQFEDGEVPSYRVYYGANVTRDYTLNGDYFQFNAEGIETGMTLSQLLGNATQTTYEGKNLASIKTSATKTIGGVAFTIVDGVLNIPNGTTAGYTNFYFDSFRVPNSGASVLWLEVSGYTPAPPDNCVLMLQESADNSTWTNKAQQSWGSPTTQNITLDNTKYYRIRIYAPPSVSFNNAKIKFQLEYGTKTDFEPYTNGASPNPDYPQDIQVSTGDSAIKITGKNLLDPSSLSPLVFEGEINNHYYYDAKLFYTVEAGKTYTLSLNVDKADVVPYVFSTLLGPQNTDMPTVEITSIRNITTVGGRVSITFTPTQEQIERAGGGMLYMRIPQYRTQTTSSYKLSNIQLELSNQATDYEPYQGQSYTIDLGSIELAKVGEYQDRIYKDDGKWYIEKQVGKVVLDGATSEQWGGELYGGYWRAYYTFSDIAPITQNTDFVAFSDYFHVSTNVLGAQSIGEGDFCQYRNTTQVYFAAPLSVQTSAGWRTWLSTHNTTVYYALATPTTTEITDDTLLYQLNFLASLYGGVNNISIVGTGAQGEMEVFIRDVMSVETDVVPEVPVRLTLTDDGVINACGCRRNVQLTMRETTE